MSEMDQKKKRFGKVKPYGQIIADNNKNRPTHPPINTN